MSWRGRDLRGDGVRLFSHGALTTDREHGDIRSQVGILEHNAVRLGVQGDPLVNADVLLGALLFEVGDGEESDIGRIVPMEALGRFDL